MADCAANARWYVGDLTRATGHLSMAACIVSKPASTGWHAISSPPSN
jgi:hypothetical protein